MKYLKNKKILVIVIVFIILIVVGVGLFISNFFKYNFKYSDHLVPGHTYVVAMNRGTRQLSVQVTSGCSYVNCHSSTDEYHTTLTAEEVAKIDKIIGKVDKLILVGILESIARDKEPFNDIEKKVTTYRGLGDIWLDDAISEIR